MHVKETDNGPSIHDASQARPSQGEGSSQRLQLRGSTLNNRLDNKSAPGDSKSGETVKPETDRSGTDTELVPSAWIALRR